VIEYHSLRCILPPDLLESLARTGDELRAQKVKQIKEQIDKGQYQTDSKEVSKSIIRSEVSGLLQNK